jgi:hypothetical protein
MILLSLLGKIPQAAPLQIKFARWLIERYRDVDLSSISPAVFVCVDEHLRQEKEAGARALVRQLLADHRATSVDETVREIGILHFTYHLSAIYEQYSMSLPDVLLREIESIAKLYGVLDVEIRQADHPQLRALLERIKVNHIAPKFEHS